MTHKEKRAPVQGARVLRITIPAGTVDWSEHLEAWEKYAARHGRDQSAERIAERDGFGLLELLCYLGRPPKTWEPR